MWLVLHMENKIRNPSGSRSWETLIFRHRICGLYYTWRTKSGIPVRVDHGKLKYLGITYVACITHGEQNQESQ